MAPSISWPSSGVLTSGLAWSPPTFINDEVSAKTQVAAMFPWYAHLGGGRRKLYVTVFQFEASESDQSVGGEEVEQVGGGDSSEAGQGNNEADTVSITGGEDEDFMDECVCLIVVSNWFVVAGIYGRPDRDE